MAIDTKDALALIDQQLEKAATPRASRKPVFLFLKEGHSALIRFLFNLGDCIVLNKHNKYAESADMRVNAICAVEIGQQCKYCARVEDDKKLTANVTFYLPVYVYGVRDKNGNPVTYKDPETEEEKPVKGFRVLELTSFGTIGTVLKTLRSYTKDEDYNHTITGNDFTLTQVGAGQKKDFTLVPKPAKPMHPTIAQNMPKIDGFHKAILEALPPATIGEVQAATSDSSPVEIEEEYVF